MTMSFESYFIIAGILFSIYNLLGIVLYYYDFACRLRSKETFLRSKKGQFRWWFDEDTQHWLMAMICSFAWPLLLASIVLALIFRFAVRIHRKIIFFLVKKNQAHVLTHPDPEVRKLLEKI